MPENNEQYVSLETIGQGAGIEMFGDELQKVLENILDANTKPTLAREVTLKVKIVPSENRDSASVLITCGSKLAPVKDVGTVVFIGKRAGKAVATERNPAQMTLDDANVVSMKGGK